MGNPVPLTGTVGVPGGAIGPPDVTELAKWLLPGRTRGAGNSGTSSGAGGVGAAERAAAPSPAGEGGFAEALARASSAREAHTSASSSARRASDRAAAHSRRMDRSRDFPRLETRRTGSTKEPPGEMARQLNQLIAAVRHAAGAADVESTAEVGDDAIGPEVALRRLLSDASGVSDVTRSGRSETPAARASATEHPSLASVLATVEAAIAAAVGETDATAAGAEGAGVSGSLEAPEIDGELVASLAGILARDPAALAAAESFVAAGQALGLLSPVQTATEGAAAGAASASSGVESLFVLGRVDQDGGEVLGMTAAGSDGAATALAGTAATTDLTPGASEGIGAGLASAGPEQHLTPQTVDATGASATGAPPVNGAADEAAPAGLVAPSTVSGTPNSPAGTPLAADSPAGTPFAAAVPVIAGAASDATVGSANGLGAAGGAVSIDVAGAVPSNPAAAAVVDGTAKVAGAARTRETSSQSAVATAGAAEPAAAGSAATVTSAAAPSSAGEPARAAAQSTAGVPGIAADARVPSSVDAAVAGAGAPAAQAGSVSAAAPSYTGDGGAGTSTQAGYTGGGETGADAQPAPVRTDGPVPAVTPQAAPSSRSNAASALVAAPAGDGLDGAVAAGDLDDQLSPVIIRQARLVTVDGGHELTLHLKPDHLGSVRVRITLQNGALSVGLAAGSSDTQRAIEAALPRLHATLLEAGLRLERLDAGFQNAGNGERGFSADTPGSGARHGWDNAGSDARPFGDQAGRNGAGDGFTSFLFDADGQMFEVNPPRSNGAAGLDGIDRSGAATTAAPTFTSSSSSASTPIAAEALRLAPGTVALSRGGYAAYGALRGLRGLIGTLRNRP
ncbi:MAG: flagellar hook-length control protein FliK [Chloroflexi bacterium]|nr:flagellar hook-length control protein FliK [Chloroflexota bacterium]